MNVSRKRIACALVGLCLAPAVAHAAVYKCVDAKGSTVYQQKPCPEADAAPSPAAAKTAEAATPPAAVPKAMAPKLAAGMTADEVRRLWGAPDQVGRPGTTAADDVEQWIYRHPDGEAKPVAITLQRGRVLRWATMDPSLVPPAKAK